MPDMPNQLRPPDAGTSNTWTFAGDGKVHVWRQGLPAVLGRAAQSPEGLVAICYRAGVTTVTAHQARALLEILPAAIAMADAELCAGCGDPVSEGVHGASEYGGCV